MLLFRYGVLILLWESILFLSFDFLFGTIKDPLFSRVTQEYFWSFVPLIIAEIEMVWIPQTFPHKR